MPTYRLTLTINRIAQHSEYSSARLTAFLFGKPKNENEITQLLYEYVEEKLGYGREDWWLGKRKSNFRYNRELVKVNSGEAKGLGHYRGELVYENTDGIEEDRRLVNLKAKRFGELL